MQLSPAEVNIAVRIVERLALPAIPVSLGYGSSSNRKNNSSRSSGSGSTKAVLRPEADWPSAPVPELDDEAFGFANDTRRLLQAAMRQHFGGPSFEELGANAAAASPSAVASNGTNSVGSGSGDAGAPLSDSSSILFSLQPGAALRTGASVAMGGVVSKPPLCLVAGDALGGRLLGWCTVACRSPQWRKVLSGPGSTSPPTLPEEGTEEPPPGDVGETDAVAGTKRAAEGMEVSSAKDEDANLVQEASFPAIDVMDEDGVEDDRDGDDDDRGDESEQKKPSASGEKASQLLGIVAQIVRAIKKHTKALAIARERGGGPGFHAGQASGVPSFDLRTRESSIATQAILGALADATFDVFADHMVDPAFHSQLSRDSSKAELTAGAETESPQTYRRGGPTAMSEVVPLVDGSSPAETVGLSVEIVSDIAWLFSALEPEAEESSTGCSGSDDRDFVTNAGPAAAVLSSAMSCWASGRLLSCMAGRQQLEFGLDLGPSSGHESGNAAAGGLPPIRPLPARLACFAVRTLLENVEVAREEGFEATEAPELLLTEESTAARACAGRSTAFHRVALITEQMPAWRERRRHLRWGQALDGPRPAVDAAGGEVDFATTYDEAAVAATAGPAAAAEVLDTLVAILCAVAQHERLISARREQAEAAGAQRRPTMYTVRSVGNLFGLTIHAISEFLGPTSSTSAVRGSRLNQGSAASTRSSLLSRAKKRRGSSPGSSTTGSRLATTPSSVSTPATATEARWAALLGLQLMSSLDRVHLAGMLLAWEPWHPWMGKTVPAGAVSASTASKNSSPFSLRQSRIWQTFCSLASQLAQACVSPRPPPPPGQGLATLMTETILSFRVPGRSSDGDPVPFLDMPTVLLIGKVSAAEVKVYQQGIFMRSVFAVCSLKEPAV